jgi:DNA-directed RNA polymerase specialized sigma24 family protein
MSRTRTIVVILFLAVAGAAAAAAVMEARRRHAIATEAADEIEDTLAGLDPVTRAAVIARVGSDMTASHDA